VLECSDAPGSFGQRVVLPPRARMLGGADAALSGSGPRVRAVGPRVSAVSAALSGGGGLHPLDDVGSSSGDYSTPVGSLDMRCVAALLACPPACLGGGGSFRLSL
jgi:hypothetical protein